MGFGAVFAAIARAGFVGVALLCLYALVVFVALALAWYFLMPPAHRRPLRDFYVARLVRDSIAEISPFSPVGGMVAAARLMILNGMNAGYAAARVAADATTEAMAQVAFLAFGLGWGITQFRHIRAPATLTRWMIAVLLLAVPGIALLIFLQQRGAGFAERMAGRFFPQVRKAARSAPRWRRCTNCQDAADAFGVVASDGLDRRRRRHLHRFPPGGRQYQPAERRGAGSVAVAPCAASPRFVPAAIGVQEAGYALLAPLFGLPEEMGLAVSLLKRAREIVVGVPVLLDWQAVEGRRRWRGAQPMG